MTLTGVESMSSDLTTSRFCLSMNTSFPLPPLPEGPAPVMMNFSSGLNTAFVCGYKVVKSDRTESGFLKTRRSHTNFDHVQL